MSVTIFHTDSGGTETWLQVNEDGTVTYHEENSGLRMMRRGTESRNRVMTGEEAKADWTSYASDISLALAVMALKKAPRSI